jgi:hypothetical protein
MAEKDDEAALERAKEAEQEGNAPTTQAGEFVREEIHHVREGKHGASSPEQAIAIGLSKARRAGVKLPPPAAGKVGEEVREKAQRDLRKGQAERKKKPAATRSRAISRALKREGRGAASRESLVRQTRKAARTRGAAARHRAALKAVQTKGKASMKRAAQKAARTRAAHRRAA